MRADGRIDLDLRATIETDDGHRIALSADGVSVLHEGETILDLLEKRAYHHGGSDLCVGERTPSLGCGDHELATAKIHIEGFMQ
jgi:hypothetical protein